MKVPQSFKGRTSTPGGALTTQANPQMARASGEGLGPSISRVGAAIGSYAEKLQAQEKFSVLRDMSDWQQELEAELVDARRSSQDDDANYFERVSGIIDTRESSMLNRVPPQYQQEFSLRTREVANRYRQQELEFGLQRKDKWFETGILKGREQRKLEVGNDANRLEDIRALEQEAILSSGLPDARKAELLREGNRSLEAVAYRQRLRDEMLSINAQPGSVDNFVNKVVGAESGGNPNAKNPRSSAAGLGGFINSTWREFMLERHPELYNEDYLKYKSNPELSREAVAWYAEKNTKALQRCQVPVHEGTLYLAHFAGPGGAVALYNADPRAPVAQILGPAAVEANPEVLGGKTAGEVVAWAAKKMGRDVAYANLDYDPSFSNLAYEDRLAIRDDVSRKIAAESAAAAKAEADRIDAQENTFLVGAEDGRYGRGNLDIVRQQGLFKDYSQLKRALSIFESKEKEDTDYRYAMAKLSRGQLPWDYASTDDKNGANAVWKKAGGAKALEERRPEAIQALNNFGRQTNIYPPEAMSQLHAMTRSSDWRNAKYGLEILTQLKATAPDAFNIGSTDEEAKKVFTYELLRGFLPEDELAKVLAPSRDAAETQRRKVLVEEANSLLKEKDYSVDNIYDKFTSWLPFSGEEPSLVPGATKGELAGEYAALFRANYQLHGNEKVADEVTTQMLQRDWGFFSAGGGKRLMKYPPNKYYPAFDGGHEYIDEQVRSMLGLDETTAYQLVPTPQTQREVMQKQPPSYGVVAMIDGKLTSLRGPADKPWVAFEITDEMRERQLRKVEMQNVETELDYAEGELRGAYQQQTLTGTPVPQELIDKVEGLRKAVREGREPDLGAIRRQGRMTLINPDGTETVIQEQGYR